MLSMTGYGTGTAQCDVGTITAQIGVVNHRHSQVSIRSDIRDLGMETRLRSQVSKHLKRGSITVQIGFVPSGTLSIDTEHLQAAWKELAVIATNLGAPAPRLEAVARLARSGGDTDIDAVEATINEAVEQALADVDAMRIQEGEHMAVALTQAHEELVALRQQMMNCADERLPQWRERLQERLNQVLEKTEITEADIVRELAMYTDRIDVSEEMVRLESHLIQLAALISKSHESIGKKLDFLLQELNREINTTGSKANDADLTQLVVQAKSVLEQMREQTANVL